MTTVIMIVVPGAYALPGDTCQKCVRILMHFWDARQKTNKKRRSYVLAPGLGGDIDRLYVVGWSITAMYICDHTIDWPVVEMATTVRLIAS